MPLGGALPYSRQADGTSERTRPMTKRLLAALATTALLTTMTTAMASAAAHASPDRSRAIPKAVNGGKVTKFIRNAVAQLPVRAEVRTGYIRDKFPHWNDVDRDCKDARSEVLRQETKRRVTGGCTVRTGKWISQYDGAVRYRASALDVDHLVPLAEAWGSGTRSWEPRRRQAFANDLTAPSTLIAVTASTNRSKGDNDPAEWMPAQRRCKYVTQWTSTKIRWGLSVDPAERAQLLKTARACPNVRFTTHRAIVKMVTTRPPGGNGSGDNGGGGGGNCTPGYSPCLPPKPDYDCAGGGGNGPGYANGPIQVTGSDPYDLDSDGDGIACED